MKAFDAGYRFAVCFLETERTGEEIRQEAKIRYRSITAQSEFIRGAERFNALRKADRQRLNYA